MNQPEFRERPLWMNRPIEAMSDLQRKAALEFLREEREFYDALRECDRESFGARERLEIAAEEAAMDRERLKTQATLERLRLERFRQKCGRADDARACRVVEGSIR